MKGLAKEMRILFMVLVLSRCLSSTPVLGLSPSLPQRNISLSLLNGSNAPNVSPAEFNAVLKPYSFTVPNMRTTLRLGFSLRRKSLDARDLGVLINVTQDYIMEQIEIHGAEAM